MRPGVIASTIALKTTFTEGAPGGGGGAVIDLLDLQWWQGLVAIIGILGLSPAPWLLGLVSGKIQFTGRADLAHQRELTARSEAFDREKAALVAYHTDVLAARDQRYADLQAAKTAIEDAYELQRKRSEQMADALTDSTEVLRVTNHVLVEFTKAAREVEPSGRGEGSHADG